MGEMAGSLPHELNQPLTAAAANTDERIAFLLPTLYGIYLNFNRF